MGPYERLLLPENLNYAWRKAKTLYHTDTGYVDSGEIGEFELNLESRLRRIHRRFVKGRYKLNKLRPLPRPKKIKDDKPIDRQYFHVTIDDQVAWIAVVNALGPALDQKMPSWSYGNRLYRPAWYEDYEENGKKHSKLEIGPYRHQSGHLYRKFQHSWPLFRRHIALTSKSMVQDTVSAYKDLERVDQLAIASAKREKLLYTQDDFWPNHTNNNKLKGNEIYHAAIDLKQFFPSIRSSAVLNGFSLAEDIVDGNNRLNMLLEDMLRFELDKTGMTTDTLELVEPVFGGKEVGGIPTGLFVSGFLANVAMLPIDLDVNKRIKEERLIAHFRYVDDHTLLAYDFDDLCNWINSYQCLLKTHNIGVEVNREKYDPEALSIWINAPSSEKSANVAGDKKNNAIRDTKIDGANPTKLLTKTLGQVSAIATTNPDILDDEDIEERLKLLEWLLLADIPSREIRPDTRAAFAAGKIATLVPMLIQETEGLVDTARSLAFLNGCTPTNKYKDRVQKETELFNKLCSEHDQKKQQRLRYCFDLLLQALREYPGKPRLFFRLHQYCRLTGYKGLPGIGQWIKEMKSEHCAWAYYYTGLSFQILAKGIPFAARTLNEVNRRRSDKEAALDHLNDVASIDSDVFSIPLEHETWFHAVARKEFGVALLSVSHLISEDIVDDALAKRLSRLARQYVNKLSFKTDQSDWKGETGRPPGVWAHLVESTLSVDTKPSSVWKLFEPCFDYSNESDRLSVRRYPEHLSSRGWNYFLDSGVAMKETDSGWVREAINYDPIRIENAQNSKRKAFTRAAKSYIELDRSWITLSEWTDFVSTHCNPFDPRYSEWTALEIIRQIIFPIVNELSVTEKKLDFLHPNNVLVDKEWTKNFCENQQSEVIDWDKWRVFVEDTNDIKLRDSPNSIKDYRYFPNYTHREQSLDSWDRRLVAIGRLLLGLLCVNHESPRLWNLRGNEQISELPRTDVYRSLAISTPTLLLIEGCLSGRRTETRVIFRKPDLFGWNSTELNDVEFDSPLLFDINELLQSVERAQHVLKKNQVTITMNQPRQLIPFRLKDFASGLDDNIGQG